MSASQPRLARSGQSRAVDALGFVVIFHGENLPVLTPTHHLRYKREARHRLSTEFSRPQTRSRTVSSCLRRSATSVRTMVCDPGCTRNAANGAASTIANSNRRIPEKSPLALFIEIESIRFRILFSHNHGQVCGLKPEFVGLSS